VQHQLASSAVAEKAGAYFALFVAEKRPVGRFLGRPGYGRNNTLKRSGNKARTIVCLSELRAQESTER
jgi:hypothetical protein